MPTPDIDSPIASASTRSATAPAPVATPDLTAYAELIVRVGIGLDAGRGVTVRAPIDAAPLARAVAAAAYRAGSPLVDVEWSDPQLTLRRLAHAPEGTLERVATWRGEAMEAAAARGDAFVGISGGDPDLFAQADPAAVATVHGAARAALRGYYRHVSRNAMPWVVVGAATPGWATSVFPDRDPADAVRALWEAIFAATRVDRDDPVAAWETHLATLDRRVEHLNARHYDALRFTSDAGTDLTVGLADGHRWMGGGSTTADGVRFVANLPTEEIFTAPHRTRVDGVVVSSKPLSYAGTLIDDFRLEFREGRVVDATAERGQATLDRLLDTDEGARRLGEVALVPHASPISQTGLLFYNTLFDENAASHLALGRAYAVSVEGGAEMDADAAKAAGLNDSETHVDFMVGDATTNVTGIRDDGAEEAVMERGAFAF